MVKLKIKLSIGGVGLCYLSGATPKGGLLPFVLVSLSENSSKTQSSPFALPLPHCDV